MNRIPILLALTLMACFPAVSHADLVVISYSNQPLTFDAELEWTEGGNPVLETLSSTAFGGSTPWDVTVLASAMAEFVVSVAQHTIAPHGGDALSGGQLTAALLFVRPGFGSGSFVTTGPHTPHSDFLSLTVTPREVGVSSTVLIRAGHEEVPATVPEAASLTLFLFGLGGFVVRCSRMVRG